MTRKDIQGFVEMLPVDDDSDLWDEVADFLAKEAVKRLDDLDPKLVLEVLCKLPKIADKDEDRDNDEDEDKDTPEDEGDEPADAKDEPAAAPATSTGSYGSSSGSSNY